MLIARVKRNRCDVPCDSICVVEIENPSKKRSVTSASDVSTTITTDPHRVILSRVDTVDCNEIGHWSGSSEMANATSGSLNNKSNAIDKCIYLDLTQQQINENSVALNADTFRNSSAIMHSPAKYSEVGDILLDAAITTAINCGDFNDISAALKLGANPSRQLSNECGGYTSLMAAVKHCNVRMADRLLSRNVDLSAVNSIGMNVIEMSNNLPHNAQSNRIKTLLQTAVVKDSDRKQISALEDNDNSYVVDIYRLETDNNQSTSTSSFATVQVKGLKILPTGKVEVVHDAYDSDWSDLGDDEGDDSSDEKAENEQYLADMEKQRASKESKGNTVKMRRARSVDTNNGVAECKVNSEESKFKGRAVCSNLRSGGVNFSDSQQKNCTQTNDSDSEQSDDNSVGSIDNGINNDFDDDEDERLPRFDYSTNVGKVIRPQIISEDGQQSALPLHVTHDSESLRQFWDEDVGPPVVDGQMNADVTESSQSRLNEMRARTGMLFASNPREFQENGLPKYGVELSDDDCDQIMTYVEDGNDYLHTAMKAMSMRNRGISSNNNNMHSEYKNDNTNNTAMVLDDCDIDLSHTSEDTMDVGCDNRNHSHVMGSALPKFASTSRGIMLDKNTVAYDSELDNSD